MNNTLNAKKPKRLSLCTFSLSLRVCKYAGNKQHYLIGREDLCHAVLSLSDHKQMKDSEANNLFKQKFTGIDDNLESILRW